MPADRDRPDEDVDAAFARIIAGWDDPPSAASQPDTPVQDAPVQDGPAGDDVPREASTDVPTQGTLPPGPAEAGPRDWNAADVEEGYTPPDPPPLPRGDLTSRLAWAGVLLGPAFLLFAGLLWRDVPRLWLGVAVLAFVGGFVALVLRLPADRDDDSDDDGAVV